MTDIEQLADTLYYSLDALEPDDEYPAILQALTTAYNKGRASATSPARQAASRANGAKAKAASTVFRGGRKVGSKDKVPRKPGRWAHKTNETKAEEVKP